MCFNDLVYPKITQNWKVVNNNKIEPFTVNKRNSLLFLNDKKQMLTEWEADEELIYKSTWRKAEGWKVVSNLPRGIWMLDRGLVVFWRRLYYRLTNDGIIEYEFLLDRHLGLEKSDKIGNSVKIEIIRLWLKGKNTLDDILEDIIYRKVNIGRTSILNIINDYKSNNTIPKAKKELHDCILMSSIDHLYPKLRLNGKIIKAKMLIANAYTDVKINTKKRKELVNKDLLAIIYVNGRSDGNLKRIY